MALGDIGSAPDHQGDGAQFGARLCGAWGLIGRCAIPLILQVGGCIPIG